MYCDKCGSHLEDGSLFCSECGARVTEEDSNNINRNNATAEEVNKQVNKVKNQSKTIKFILIIAVSVIVLFTGGFTVYKLFFSNSPKNTVSKFLKCVEKEEWDEALEYTDYNKDLTYIDEGYDFVNECSIRKPEEYKELIENQFKDLTVERIEEIYNKDGFAVVFVTSKKNDEEGQKALRTINFGLDKVDGDWIISYRYVSN